ncbi:4Fe-4S single cluster domain-containing protein [Nocardioides sp. W7]|uniref:4Fe-4S single cluster domain-containing protein n=1 Tax=Nocardioides sp. W7 TaxID=2931390 RepID=UPI001FD606C1|nr:4Fe-4S single cluster domain-containing protein [Nocardioides sp. W7]
MADTPDAAAAEGLLMVSDTARDIVDVLGPGHRSVVWVQGCRIGCAGCMVPETWGRHGGREVDPRRLAAELLDDNTADLTVSGGEPTEQPAAVAVLLGEARRRGRTTWVYTGRVLEDLVAEADPDVLAMLELVDVLVDGPFDQDRAGGVGYRGSRNQRLLHLSGAVGTREAEGGAPGRIEIRVDDTGLSVVGIPEPGALERLEEDLAARGIAVRPRRRA